MRNDDIFDKRVRVKLNQEVDTVPENINRVFDEALDNAFKNRKRRSKKRVGIVAASVVACVITGITISPYATNIPILKNIHELFNNDTYKNYDDYATDINLNHASKGLKLTINKVVYDGLDINLFYTLESEKKLTEYPFFTEMKIQLNGEKQLLGLNTGGQFYNDNKTVIGEILIPGNLINTNPTQYTEDNDINSKLPDEFTLGVNISKVRLDKQSEIKVNWNFDIPVSNEKSKGKVIENDIKVDIGDIRKGTFINNLIATPLNTIIQTVNVEGKDNSYFKNILTFLVLDDKGEFLEKRPTSRSGAYTDTDGKYLTYNEYSFKEIGDDIKSVTIIPNLMVFDMRELEGLTINADESVVPAPRYDMTVTLNLEGQTQLLTNDGEEYGVITKVDVLDDKTILHYKPTTGSFDIFEMIYDTERNFNASYQLDKYYGGKIEHTTYDAENNEFLIQFTKLIGEGKYTLSYYDKSKRDIYYFDRAVTVKLNR